MIFVTSSGEGPGTVVGGAVDGGVGVVGPVVGGDGVGTVVGGFVVLVADGETDVVER